MCVFKLPVPDNLTCMNCGIPVFEAADIHSQFKDIRGYAQYSNNPIRFSPIYKFSFDTPNRNKLYEEFVDVE